MKKRNGIGITKMMFGLSSVFLVIVIIGFLVSPILLKNTKNSNYMFSDSSDSIIFEQKLNENEIPFEKVSSNVFSVKPDWKNEADNVYQIFLEEIEK